MLLVPALDYRYSWSSTPTYVVFLGDALAALCFAITFLAYREIAFASATIEVAQDQRVISTTDPTLSSAIPCMREGCWWPLGTPLALGSSSGLVASIAVLPALIWRLLDEERLLSRNLPGYAEYCDKVRWRLIPRVFYRRRQ